jgi:hypothetical protein
VPRGDLSNPALFFLALVVMVPAALMIPGGSLLIALLALATPLRRDRRRLRWIFAVGGAFALLTFVALALHFRI